MPNLTMGREGSQFFGDGVQLSWPRGGERQIVPAPAELSLRLRQRIAEGSIVVTDDPPNREAWVSPASLITGRTSGLRLRDRAAPRVETEEVPSVVVINEPATAVESEVRTPRGRNTRGSRRASASRRGPAR